MTDRVVGVELEGMIELRFGTLPVPVVVCRAVSQARVCFCQAVVQLQRLGSCYFRFSHRLDWRQRTVFPRPQCHVAVCKTCACTCGRGVLLDCPLETIDGPGQSLRSLRPVVASFQVEIIGLEILLTSGQYSGPFKRQQLDLELRHDGERDLVLNLEHVCDLTVEAVRP